MGLTTGLVKLLLFIFNGVFALCGIILIAVGVVVMVGIRDIKHFLDPRMLTAAYILIAVGVIIFMTAFLGIYGALAEHFFILIGFAVLVSSIFIAEVAVGIAINKHKGRFEGALKNELSASMDKYGKDDIETNAWDGIQYKLKCCGINGSAEWTAKGKQIPVSCCDTSKLDIPNINSIRNSLRASNVTETSTLLFHSALTQHKIDTSTLTCVHNIYYKEGCYGKIKSIVLSKSNIVVAVGIGIAVLQIAGIVLSCLLAFSVC